jgi:hypothetical protein
MRLRTGLFLMDEMRGQTGLTLILSQRVPSPCVLCKVHCKCMETQEQVSGRKESHVTDLPHRENRVRVVGV